jgi:hypothetical protein
LPTDRKEHVSIGWLGAALLTGGVSVLLIWVSFAGKTVYYAWIYRESALYVTAGVLLLVATVWVSPALNPDHPAPDSPRRWSPGRSGRRATFVPLKPYCAARARRWRIADFTSSTPLRPVRPGRMQRRPAARTPVHGNIRGPRSDPAAMSTAAIVAHRAHIAGTG